MTSTQFPVLWVLWVQSGLSCVATSPCLLMGGCFGTPRSRVRLRVNILSAMRQFSLPHPPTRTRTHTHARAHAHTHARAHTHTHTHTHTLQGTQIFNTTLTPAPPLVPVESHINLGHVPFYSCTIDFNITIPSTAMSSKWSLSYWLSHHNLLCPLFCPFVPY